VFAQRVARGAASFVHRVAETSGGAKEALVAVFKAHKIGPVTDGARQLDHSSVDLFQPDQKHGTV